MSVQSQNFTAAAFLTGSVVGVQLPLVTSHRVLFLPSIFSKVDLSNISSAPVTLLTLKDMSLSLISPLSSTFFLLLSASKLAGRTEQLADAFHWL